MNRDRDLLMMDVLLEVIKNWKRYYIKYHSIELENCYSYECVDILYDIEIQNEEFEGISLTKDDKQLIADIAKKQILRSMK